jgi:hypothetical protein
MAVDPYVVAEINGSKRCIGPFRSYLSADGWAKGMFDVYSIVHYDSPKYTRIAPEKAEDRMRG